MGKLRRHILVIITATALLVVAFIALPACGEAKLTETTTTVASLLNPSTYGDAVTFTATVSAASGTPTGTVTFKEGANVLGYTPLSSWQATYTTSTLSVGNNSITAVYSGDASFATSTSTALTQTVNPKALTITANSTSKTYGETESFTGTEFTSNGLVNADTVTSVTLASDGAAANAAVGSYAIVPSAAVGTGLTNYAITYVNGTLTVNGLPPTTTIVLQADLSNISPELVGATMEVSMAIIRQRLGAHGIGGTTVRRQGDEQILVQIIGSIDAEEMTRLVSQQGILDFRENPSGDGTTWVIATDVIDGQTYNLTGEYLKPNAKVELTGTTGTTPEVAIEFNDLGAKIFYDVTYRNWHKQLAIFLDDVEISAPTVFPDNTTQEGISGGKAVISGPTLAECQTLAIQLNSGALPLPLHVVQVSVG